jgi:hypothetical protein
MQADYVSLLWNLKIATARAKDLSNISDYPTMSERIDMDELSMTPLPAVLTADDYLDTNNFVTRSFYLFKANPGDYSTWEMRYYPSGYPSSTFNTLVKGSINAIDIFRPTESGPQTNNYNDCFVGIDMRSKIRPSAPTASDIQYNAIMRFVARCRRAGK